MPATIFCFEGNMEINARLSLETKFLKGNLFDDKFLARRDITKIVRFFFLHILTWRPSRDRNKGY